MTLVTIEDVQRVFPKPFNDVQIARLTNDLAVIQKELESWAHQKFEPTRVENERHLLTGGGPLFLWWGEPAGPIDVRFNSPAAPAQAYNFPGPWGNSYMFPVNFRGRVWVSYDVDVSHVAEYIDILKHIITRAAVASLMKPDIVRYRVTNSYSVEGLSIQYENGQQANAGGNAGGTVPDVETVDLSALAGLRRTVIV